MTETRAVLHPLAVLALPLAAIAAALLVDGVVFGLCCTAISLLALALGRPRVAPAVAIGTVVMLVVLWTGFAVSFRHIGGGEPVIAWLPLAPTPSGALLALSGALRIVTIMALFVTAMAFVRTDILADSLIERFRVPYRLVDVVGLGGRFAVLIRRDIQQARSLARLRTRGSRVRAVRLLAGLMIPVLMAAFRHADHLAIAMDARGFGADTTRTVHHSMPVRARDVIVLVAVWAASAAAAIWLGHV